MLRVASAALAFALTGCATVAHGTTQTISVVSSLAGARVALDSAHAGVTPLFITVPRGGDHVVSLTFDTFPAVRIPLTRHLSPLVYANIFIYVAPAILDVYSGAAYNLSPSTVNEVFPVSAAPARVTVSGWGLARGDHVRFTTLRSRTDLIDGIVDSTVADWLFLRPRSDSAGSTAPRPGPIALTDARNIAVNHGPDRVTAGMSGLHYAALVTSPAALIPFGAIVTVMAMPPGFVLGYANAPPRWSPLAAHRAGIPLFTNDRVRLRRNDDSRLSARLANMDSAGLLLAMGDDTVRVARTDVRSMQRADGFDFRKGAAYGVATGFVLAAIACSSGNLCGHSLGVAELSLVSSAGAMLGAFVSPAFAPRRWVDVLHW